MLFLLKVSVLLINYQQRSTCHKLIATRLFDNCLQGLSILLNNLSF